MRLTTLFVLMGCLHISAKSIAQTITLEARSYSLKEVFKVVRQQTNYKVVYNVRFLDGAKAVSISARQMPLQQFLKQALRDQDLHYSIEENTIFIGRKIATNPEKLNVVGTAQTKQLTLSGKVTNTEGQALGGVTVKVKGTSLNVMTKPDGSFTIPVPAARVTLIFSSVGFSTQELIAEAGEKELKIALSADLQQLNEIVVVGYTAKSKNELTSAVAVVSGAKLKDVTANSVGTMLQGKVAGLQVVNSSGAPGANAEIRLRGVSSVNANQSPLIVVDGIIGGNYDPNDVENITVLKDAGATALYGSQANAGVIIVTTKNAKEEGLGFEAKVASGFRNPDFGKLKLMNSRQLYDYQKEFYRDYIPGATDNSYKIDLGKFYAERPLDLLGQNYDWSKESFKSAPIYNFYLSARGKSTKNDYYIGASYYRENGTFVKTNYERLNLRGNSTYHINPRLDVINNINISGSRGMNNDYMDMYYAFLNLPWDNPYDNNGQPINVDGASSFKWWSRDKINPIHTVANSEHTTKGFDINYDLGANYRITDWLTFTSTNRVSASYNKGVNYVSPLAAGTYHGDGYLDELNAFNYGIISNQLFKFNFPMNDHVINGFVGGAFESGRTEYSGGSGKGLPEGLKVPNVISSNQKLNGYHIGTTLQSLLSQVNYSYKNRYFISGSYRYDGSSNFVPSKRYGGFPSLSAAWSVSSEEFMASNKTIDNLKVRASYGFTGTQDIGASRYLGLFSLTAQYNNIVGAIPYQLASPNLTWESKRQMNLGLDIGLFKRVNLTLDAYRNDTKDLLLQVAQPLSVGFETKWENAGTVINKGIEIGISSTNIQTQHFQWTTDFTINFNKNKLTGFPSDIVRTSSTGVTQIYRNGGNLFEFYMPKWLGVDPENGAPLWEKLVDNNGAQLPIPEKTADYAQATNQEVGSALPKYQGGFNNSFRYKNFQLSVSTYFNYGNKVFSNNLRYMMNDGHEPYYNQIRLPDGAKIWTAPGDLKATEPSPQNSANSTETSSRYLKNGSYFAIRNLNFSYTLPQEWARKMAMKAVAIGATADNVAIFTNFLGQDPQTTVTQASYAMPGVSDFKYPNNRQYLLNLTFNF